MSRWKVERWADLNVAAWVAWDEDAPDRMMLFPTHAEALDYADKKARTREVVLPRGPKSGTLRIDVTYDGDDVHANALVNQSFLCGELPAANLAGLAGFLYTLAERAKHAGT